MKQQEEHHPIISIMTIIFCAVYVALVAIFLYLLHTKTDAPFGLVEISFAVVAGIVLGLIVQWTRSIIRKNPYLGLVAGIFVIVALVYALFLPYNGPYTTGFAIVGSLIAIVYFVYCFFLYRKLDAVRNKPDSKR
jgi:O-antigen/teichoic acid export membrane protein